MMPATRAGFSTTRIAIAMALAVLTACGGTTEVDPGGTTDNVPASLTPVTTDTLRGTVGAAASVPVSVVVKNQAGQFLSGIQVTFAIGSGGGALANPTARTDAAGQASTQWTFG